MRRLRKMRVTFDSHVLGKVIFPEKRKRDPGYTCLKDIVARSRTVDFRGLSVRALGLLRRLETIRGQNILQIGYRRVGSNFSLTDVIPLSRSRSRRITTVTPDFTRNL